MTVSIAGLWDRPYVATFNQRDVREEVEAIAQTFCLSLINDLKEDVGLAGRASVNELLEAKLPAED